MAVTQTPNYNLNKYDAGDTGWDTGINQNFDTIDSQMHDSESRLNKLEPITKQQFEVIAENNRRKFDGSGFVEWGKVYNSAISIINEGMFINSDKVYLRLGRRDNATGDSNTPFPIVNVNGYTLKIISVNNSDTTSEDNLIAFPDPPDSADNLYREDLVLLESWHEKISDKDWFVPYGNVQYGRTTYTTSDGTTITLDSITTALDSSYQGYSAFADWDTTTVGYGKKWSDLTEAEKQSILADKWNNIYIDEDGEFVQVRYRIRVIPSYGSNDDLPDRNNFEKGFLKDTGISAIKYYNLDGIEYLMRVQGNSIDSSIDGNSGTDANKYLTYDAQVNSNSYAVTGAYTNSNGGKPTIFAIPIATVSRRNSGAFHPVYNINGSAKFDDSGTAKFWYEYTDSSSWSITTFPIVAVNIEDTNLDGTNDLFQFKVLGDHTDVIKPDYYITVSGSTGNDGRYYVTDSQYDGTNTIITVFEEIPDTTADGVLKSDFQYVKYCFDHATGGTISSGISGRPDGLYADEINERDVKDLRMPAKTDYSLYTESGATRVLNKYVANDVRGSEGIWIYSKEYIINELSGGDNAKPVIPQRLDEYIRSLGFDGLHAVSYAVCSGQLRIFQNHAQLSTLPTDWHLWYSYTDNRHIHFAAPSVTWAVGDILTYTYMSTYRSNHILFHSDIIGDPANYPQAWTEFGVMGVPLIVDEDGNDYRPDGSNKTWKLSRKFSSIKLVLKYSGGSYIVLTDGTDYSTDSYNNTITFTTAPATTDIIQIFYETYCNNLEPTINMEYQNNSLIHFNNSNNTSAGSILTQNLLNKVPISIDAWQVANFKVKFKKIDTDTVFNTLLSTGENYHEDYELNAYNPAVKTFVYITEKNGALYPVFVFKELKYDSGSSSWGDNNKFEITGYVNTMTDDNGNTILYGQKIAKTPLGFAKNNIVDVD